MTRIIAGTAGGRRLRTPPGAATRPTSDRVREALFSRLEHLDVVAGARVLDLYAGSGALGLEAASRGAAAVTLVESDRVAARVLRGNAALLSGSGPSHPGQSQPGLSATALVVCEDTVERTLLTGPRPAGPDRPEARMDLVFLDPPYSVSEDVLADVLTLLVSHPWLSLDALVVVERSSRSPEPRWPPGLEAAEERRYGETRMWFADAPGPDAVA